MSLNIFIDVDGTLLNTNEGVDPRAEEILRQIRRKLDAEYPDSGLYLWSGAGGDYARSKAEEHGLAGFFSGFAGKPDVIIDDNPSSVFPRRTVIWQDDSQWQNLIPTMFTEFSPSNGLNKVVEDVIKTTVRDYDGNITSDLYDKRFPNSYRNPIPFFGDLENAEILTLAVNPSPSEFEEARCWKPEMEAKELSFRLVNYFRVWNPPHHGWFAPLETILRQNNCSYLSNTAHIDLSPRATRKMGEFHGNSTKFLDTVDGDAKRWFPQLFQLAKKKKRFRIRGKIISRSDSGNNEWFEWPYLDDYIKENLPTIWALIEQCEHDRI